MKFSLLRLFVPSAILVGFRNCNLLYFIIFSLLFLFFFFFFFLMVRLCRLKHIHSRSGELYSMDFLGLNVGETDSQIALVTALKR